MDQWLLLRHSPIDQSFLHNTCSTLIDQWLLQNCILIDQWSHPKYILIDQVDLAKVYCTP